MSTLHETRSGHEFLTDPAWDACDPQRLAQTGAEEHWLLAAGQDLLARCSLWWSGTPPLEGQRTGFIGHFCARDADSTQRLLDHVCVRLREAGCGIAIGPLDGNTFRRYRFITERGSEPPFFLEPDNPDAYPGWWLAAGFAARAEYCSALVTDLTIEVPGSAEIDSRLAERGITLRTMEPGDFASELRRIYRVAAPAFADAFLASPFTEEDYLAQYLPLQHLVTPKAVLLAEQGDRPAGFMFNLPDLAQQQRGEAISTLIVKTFAVHPDFAGQGIGQALWVRTHRLARELGFTRAIHALMSADNRSLTMSRHQAAIFRRYTLYARTLAP